MDKKFKKNFKVGDKVVVITGNNKGEKGKVLSFVRKENRERCRVLIEGVALRQKILKKSQENPEGSKIKVETSIHYSNIKLDNEGTDGTASKK